MKLYFDSENHKYFDSRGVVYTSATQLLDKYCDKFDVKSMSSICAVAGMRGNVKYRNKSANQIAKEWKSITEESIISGNNKHNFLEEAINFANGFKNYKFELESNEIYTINHILKSTNLGIVDIEKLKQHSIYEVYPDIYTLYKRLSEKGFKIYAEVAVYDEQLAVSGRIDGLAINEGNCYIIDYKTYRNPITTKAGYFKKDKNGNITNEFVETGKTFKEPISHLECSSANKCFMQLSIYAKMLSLFGLKTVGGCIIHIRTNRTTDEINFIPVTFYMDEAYAIMKDNYNKLNNKQLTLMYEQGFNANCNI